MSIFRCVVLLRPAGDDDVSEAESSKRRKPFSLGRPMSLKSRREKRPSITRRVSTLFQKNAQCKSPADRFKVRLGYLRAFIFFPPPPRRHNLLGPPNPVNIYVRVYIRGASRRHSDQTSLSCTKVTLTLLTEAFSNRVAGGWLGGGASYVKLSVSLFSIRSYYFPPTLP